MQSKTCMREAKELLREINRTLFRTSVLLGSRDFAKLHNRKLNIIISHFAMETPYRVPGLVHDERKIIERSDLQRKLHVEKYLIKINRDKCIELLPGAIFDKSRYRRERNVIFFGGYLKDILKFVKQEIHHRKMNKLQEITINIYRPILFKI